MIFAYPEFLFALAAISVPIIIHLFNFRRFKKVYFSDIRFLKDVEIETKSRNKLKNLLILLSRILAITFLVLAFARPFIPTGENADKYAGNNVLVYIDNSFSMNAEGEEGTLLEEAKAKAIEVGSAFANGQQIRLLTNDFASSHLRDLSFEEFKNEIAAIKASPITRTLNEITSRCEATFDTQRGTNVYYISDLQKIVSANTETTIDSLLSIYAIPIKSDTKANIYVDSAWFPTPTRLPMQEDELNVRIRNSGDTEIEKLSVKLTINGIQRAVATTNIPSNDYEDVVLNFTNAESGVQLTEISIEDYPITYDDKFLLSYNLARTINVLCVEGDESSISVRNVFESETNFSYTAVPSKSLDYSLLDKSNLLVLNEVASFSSGMVQEVMKFVRNGGSLLFIPAEKTDLSLTNELLLAVGAEPFLSQDSGKIKVEQVNLKSTIFKNVFTEWKDRIDLPSTSKYYSLQTRVNSSSERLLLLDNGAKFLSTYSLQNGKSYVLATPLKDGWTNFHKHALFVPTIYNIALNSFANRTSSETIGSGDLIPLNSTQANSEILKLESVDGLSSFVPERITTTEATGIHVHNQVSKASHFILSTENNDTIQPVSFNYNRTESLLEYYSIEEFSATMLQLGVKSIQFVDSNTEFIANEIQELNNGKQLWRLFLILALAALLFEILLIRIL